MWSKKIFCFHLIFFRKVYLLLCLFKFVWLVNHKVTQFLIVTEFNSIIRIWLLYQFSVINYMKYTRN